MLACSQFPPLLTSLSVYLLFSLIPFERGSASVVEIGGLFRLVCEKNWILHLLFSFSDMEEEGLPFLLSKSGGGKGEGLFGVIILGICSKQLQKKNESFMIRNSIICAQSFSLIH